MHTGHHRPRPARRRKRSSAQPSDYQGNVWAASPLASLRGVVNVLGPTTLITALLLYFGYVGTAARFEYFGVYLSMVDLSNQELLLSGLEVVYVPALVISLSVLVMVGAHATVSWLLISGARELTWSVAGLIAVAGLLLIGRAFVGILVPGVTDTETPLGLTPLALALGPVFIAYSTWIAVAVWMAPTSGSVKSSRFTHWYATSTVWMLRRMGTASVLTIFIVGIFWASNSFALAFGAGRGYQDALRFKEKPEVVLDVRERLLNPPPGVTETNLDSADGTGFRYRYRHLRLLIESGGRMFLIPENWTREGRTIIVPHDNNVRIQLIPAPTIYEAPSEGSYPPK